MKTFVELIEEVRKSIDQEDNKILSAIEDNIELTSTATLPHAVGTYFVLDKVVYKVTTAIATGDTIEEEVNVTVADDIMTMIAALSTENETLTNRVKGNWFKGGKNLLPYPYYDTNGTTSQGFAFVVNDDGSIYLNGSYGSGTRPSFNLARPMLLKAGTYVISKGSTSLGALIRVIDAVNTSTVYGLVSDTTSYTEFTLSQDTNVFVQVLVSNNSSVDFTIYPMLCYASDFALDDTYEPSAKTNQQLTKDKAEQAEVNDIVNVYGAKNLLPFDIAKIIARNTGGTWSGNTYTFNGVTFTVNDDGSVTVDGTATAITEFILVIYTDNVTWFKNLIRDKTVTLSGCPSGGGSTIYTLRKWGQGSGGTYYDTGNGVTFTADAESLDNYNWNFQIRIYNGITVSNLTFYPMLRLASITDDTYEPYAKSNRELTEDVESIEAEMVRGGGYVYPLSNYFYHIAITATKGSGQMIKLITNHGEVKMITSGGGMAANTLARQKVLINDNTNQFDWTYSVDGMTANLNCTGHVVGFIISNSPLTFTAVDTSTPEANAMNTLNLALLSNS